MDFRSFFNLDDCQSERTENANKVTTMTTMTTMTTITTTTEHSTIASSTLPAPKRIQKLDPVVVNRIAAGEVIHRPAHALKELLENAIDAGATTIQISVKDGGLKSLVIQDNGCGIALEDLPILCERFTTSKLSTFEDLSTIATYGFRGEALASISHVAHVSVVTRTADAPCAYRATYADGQLVAERPGAACEPRACAGNIGTTLTVQDLFYNVRSRLRALHSKSREHAHVLDVVARYAVHNAGVAIALRRGTHVDLHTQAQATPLDNIRTLFGATVARELLHVDSTEADLSFSCHFTNPNFSAKQFNFLLFINNRLVESTVLKRALDALFGPLLPKGMHPFIYLAIQVRPDHVDVNVHPTKKEVILLHEAQVVERVTERVRHSLEAASASRHYTVQSLLPTSLAAPPAALASAGTPAASAAARAARADPLRVRTDARASTLDAWLYRMQHADDRATAGAAVPAWRDLELASIAALQAAALDACDTDLHLLLADHTFVGLARGPYALVQSATYLYLVNVPDLAADFFYLRSLALFSNFPKHCLAEPVHIETQARHVLAQQTGVLEKLSISPEAAAKKIVSHLISRADLLSDYFSVCIDTSGTLTALPHVLQGYPPPSAHIPLFLVRLCTEVDWEDEQRCLDGILRELALLFTPTMDDAQSIEHVLFPALRDFYPNRTSRKFLTEIANLHELYKVFERC